MLGSTPKSDAQIKQDVLHELTWDRRVKATDVGVEVDGGVVTLTGTVSSWGMRHAAQEAAHRVAGVLDVANDIEVTLPGSPVLTDTDIARAVRETLTWDVFVPDQRIRSTVCQGVVTLEGTVDFLSEREDAERAVRNLAGVRRVLNRLAVAPQVKATATEVREAIAAALERRALREAQGIRIEVEDGRVTIAGRVRSWGEKRAVLGTAAYVQGVDRIEDQLVIDATPETPAGG